MDFGLRIASSAFAFVKDVGTRRIRLAFVGVGLAVAPADREEDPGADFRSEVTEALLVGGAAMGVFGIIAPFIRATGDTG